ncbi:hypothetical protein [Neisseria sp. Ec49-e6-T10]|uniref:hypothetical protein n=1 Tax=Neisseria sp. Ec49-e6-T10 TaxID=3140744 RepID=UPI003EB72E13
MKWTNEKPTKEGWYWFKLVERHKTFSGLLKYEHVNGKLIVTDKSNQLSNSIIEVSKKQEFADSAFYSSEPLPMPEQQYFYPED